MTQEILETVERDTAEPIRATVIWMHGLGADGHDFEPVVPEFALPPELGLRFVFPHAPMRPVTINGGQVMRAWYDILDLEHRRQEDEEGVRQSEVAVQALIRREVGRGIPPERIVLAGFSQGGAMALHTGLRYPERLAGIISLSAYLPLRDTVENEVSAANADVPIFMAHGVQDPLIPLAAATASRDGLESLGYRVTWRDYSMPHSVCPDEIRDISGWLAEVLERGANGQAT